MTKTATDRTTAYAEHTTGQNEAGTKTVTPAQAPEPLATSAKSPPTDTAETVDLEDAIAAKIKAKAASAAKAEAKAIKAASAAKAEAKAIKAEAKAIKAEAKAIKAASAAKAAEAKSQLPATVESKVVATTRPATVAKTKPQQPGVAQLIEVPPMASRARAKKRHWGILLSFILAVLLPTSLAGYYMYAIATDQYESRVGFSVRTEEKKSALDVLGGLTGMSSSSSTDTDILYEFIQGREMVERVNAQMDLRKVFTRPWFDPVFSLKDDSSIEELVDFWPHMVRVYYDKGTRLIEVRAFAFTREDATRLAELVFAEANTKINTLSAVARNDGTLYAKEELDKAIKRLIKARQTLTSFRIRTQIVDPQADIAGQMGLLNTLQSQLAEALIEQDLLLQTARKGDPRLDKIELRISVIEDRIAQERQKLGVGSPPAGGVGQPSESYAEVIGEFEKLQLEMKFAQTAYVSARSAYDGALAEAQRTSRYLTAYLDPTHPETSTAPKRLLLTALVAVFALIGWFILVLIYYSFRDRR